MHDEVFIKEIPNKLVKTQSVTLLVTCLVVGQIIYIIAMYHVRLSQETKINGKCILKILNS